MNRTTLFKRVNDFCLKTWQTFLSFIKIVLQSKCIGKLPQATSESLLILGNGPSLKAVTEQHEIFRKGKQLMAVNYAVLDDYFPRLKPLYYVVADSVFFTSPQHRDRLFPLMAELITWEIHLFVPASAKRLQEWQTMVRQNTCINVHYFNLTPVEGFRWFTHWAYVRGLGMPRPRNVLIPSIMLGINMKYKKVYLAGADHSWLKEIWVRDDNTVMEDLRHSYDKDGAQEYQSDKHLHDLLYSMYVAFKAYHDIFYYTCSQGTEVWNTTEGSYIDAFPRHTLLCQ